jgi:DnaJ-class molecular chaperone
MKLKNIRNVGRYYNRNTKKAVNIKKGRRMGYGVDVFFYLYRGSRIFISDKDLSDQWVKIDDGFTKNVDCKTCDGTGSVLPEPNGNFLHDLTGIPCPDCDKEGDTDE